VESFFAPFFSKKEGSFYKNEQVKKTSMNFIEVF